MIDKSDMKTSTPSLLQQAVTDDVVNNPKPKLPMPTPPTRNQAIKSANDNAKAFRMGDIKGVWKNIETQLDYYWSLNPEMEDE